MVAKQLVTAADLWAMEDNGWVYELLDGELIRMPPPGGEHGWIGADLARLIGNYVVERRLGEVFVEAGYQLGDRPDTVVGPDVSFVREERLPPEGTWGGYFQMAPDLAIEIISPTNRAGKVARKVRRYLAAGTRLVVAIYPTRRRLRLHAPDREPVELGEAEALGFGDVIPGLTIPVAEVFRRLPRAAPNGRSRAANGPATRSRNGSSR